MTAQNDREWFEAAWAHREEVVYPHLFGDIGASICVLEPSIFLETFRQESFDPRWLHSGVFESPPNEKHDSWLYISSGLSNAWEASEPNASGYSGLGCEFVFETHAKSQWAIVRMQHVMAFQTLISVGRFPGRELLDVYDRIPLRAPLTSEPTLLRYLMVAPSNGLPASFALATGHVDLLRIVGITDAEAQFARDRSGEQLLAILCEAGAFPITDPRRACTVGSGQAI